MIFELQRADGVRDLSMRIRLAVREVVHRIDAPLVAGAMMLGVQDAVHHRVAHVEVRRRHVDLGAQRARAVGKLARLHALEQVRFSSTERLRYGLSLPGSVSVPRYSRISSAVRSQTYALPSLISCTAQSYSWSK